VKTGNVTSGKKTPFKVKAVPVQAMKAQRGRRGKAPLILNIGTDVGEWSVGRSGCFTSGEGARVSIE
jgi:hypothetical protein